MKSILIVEDDFLIAEDYWMILEVVGWQVIGPAATVDHALDLLREAPPPAAILDLFLQHRKDHGEVAPSPVAGAGAAGAGCSVSGTAVVVPSVSVEASGVAVSVAAGTVAAGSVIVWSITLSERFMLKTTAAMMTAARTSRTIHMLP